MNKEKRKEYVDLCKKVWREVRSDKEKWVDETMQEMEEGMRHHWQGAFQVKTGVSQGCVVSPLLFNCVMDRILKDTTNLLEGGLHIMYTSAGSLFLSYQNITTCIQNVLYTDELTVIAETRRELQLMLDAVLDGTCRSV